MSSQTNGPFSLDGAEAGDWAKAVETSPEPIVNRSLRFEFIFLQVMMNYGGKLLLKVKKADETKPLLVGLVPNFFRQFILSGFSLSTCFGSKMLIGWIYLNDYFGGISVIAGPSS